MAIKKSTTKNAAKKVPAKKAPAKKAAKKVAAKKAAKKAVKKTALKKAVTKKTVKNPVSKQAPKTSIIANVDVGFGNSLYIRGEGAGLSWTQGTELKNISPYEWAYETTAAKGEVTFKFLINDEHWAEGDNLSVAAGGTSISSPTFSW